MKTVDETVGHNYNYEMKDRKHVLNRELTRNTNQAVTTAVCYHCNERGGVGSVQRDSHHIVHSAGLTTCNFDIAGNSVRSQVCLEIRFPCQSEVL